MCRDAKRAFRHVGEEKGLSYEIEVDPALPASIVSDEQRLRQVVRNLLSNAFKFTDQGGVTLSIGRGPENAISFTVSDTGVGIPADKLKLIFEAFQQADGTTSRKYGGTGLGLSISRELARLLGGELQVQSGLGEGSRFSLRLPLRGNLAEPTVEHVDGAPQPVGIGEATLQGRKVLVIDDDVRTGFALTAMLERYGMKVVYAENGLEGIERLSEHANTDLVLLDIMMPGIDGYETARAIRGIPRFERLPIISLTAKAMKGDREKALAAGASDYIAKPVDVDQLVSMMRAWLDGRRSGDG